MRVAVNGLNVRSTPSKQGRQNVVATLPRDTKVDAKGPEGEWAKIDYRGRLVFVFGRYIEPLAPAPNPAASGSASSPATPSETSHPSDTHAGPSHADDPEHISPHPPAAAQTAETAHAAPAATTPAVAPPAPNSTPPAPATESHAPTTGAGHPPPPLDHMGKFVYQVGAGGATQQVLVYVSAGQLTHSPDVFMFFHGQWANYGIDPAQLAARKAAEQKRIDAAKEAGETKIKPDETTQYVESGRNAAEEAMQHAQGKNVISILPQGVMGGGGSAGGQMNAIIAGGLPSFVDAVMKHLKADLGGDQMQAGRIALAGHSAGGYEGIQESLKGAGKDRDLITDITLMDQEYSSGGQYEQVLHWMFQGQPNKNLRVVAQSNQLLVGQFDAKHKPKGLWDRFVGPDALPDKAQEAGFSVVDLGGAGTKQGANKTIVYHAQVRKGAQVQCDVLVLRSELSHHPLRDDVMDDAILNIGQGAAGSHVFGTLKGGVAPGEKPAAAPASVPTTAPPTTSHDHVTSSAHDPAAKDPAANAQHDPDPTKPDKPGQPPPLIHVASNSASPDLYKNGNVLDASRLTRNGGDKKQRELEDVEFKFKQDVYARATQNRMKDKIYGGLADEELVPVSGWPMNKPERYRKILLPSLYNLLNAMKADWEAGKPMKGISTKDVKGIGIISAYRGPKEEMHLWDNYFLKYLTATTALRKATGDEYGSKAIDVMIHYISARKATPGHSNHSNGTAVDLWALSKTHEIPNSFDNQVAWKASWHYAWLNTNAASYNFRNYKAEAWHWEYIT
jgi:hypothetical protein